MSRTIVKFDGLFETWTYDVSHGRLLLRRNKNNGFNTRVDVVFTNTVYIQGMTSWVSLWLEELAPEDLAEDCRILPQVLNSSLKRYRVTSQNGVGYIVAGNVFWNEDDGSYSEPSAIYKPGSLMRELGKNGYS